MAHTKSCAVAEKYPTEAVITHMAAATTHTRPSKPVVAAYEKMAKPFLLLSNWKSSIKM